VDKAKTIESAFAGVFKARGFRKRGSNWFRTTSTGEYQVINLQKSPWGGGGFYLNLGWDPSVAAGDFRSANFCTLSIRAEHTDVIPSIEVVRPDGLAARDLSGILLLDAEMISRIPEESLLQQLTEVVIIPIADFMDRTPSLVDLVPLLSAKPQFAWVSVREELNRRGFTLPAK
jgi:hypothetical protein